MKKNAKVLLRITALVLAIFMVAACAGCNGGGNSQKDNSTGTTQVETSTAPENQQNASTTQEQESDELPDVDMGGYVFKVADYGPERWEYKEGAFDFGVKVIERNKYVEKKFNCKIEFMQVDPGSFFDKVQPAVMAGDKFADIILPTMWGFGKFISADILTDIKKVPHLKLDKPYWDQAVTELTTIGGKTYGVSNQLLQHAQLAWGIYFNKKLIQELGLEDPYQLVRDKKWTFEKMREMAKAAVKDLNGDGLMDQNDRYGFAGSEGDLVNAMYSSAGLKMLDTDKDGKVKYVMNNPKTMDFLNITKQIMLKDGIFFPRKPEQDWHAHYDAFKAGKVLFFSYLAGMEELRDMEDDWGFVLMPMGPGATDYKCWVDHNVPVIGITMNNKDLDKTGMILEALAWKSQEETQVLLDYYQSTFFRDDESLEMQKMLFGRSTYDLAYLSSHTSPAIKDGTLNILTRCGFADPQAEPASSIAAVQEATQLAVDDFFNKKK